MAVLAAERPAARLSFSPVLLAALAVGLVPFALHVWAVLHGGLDQDDFVITYRAAQAGPFDPGYLFQDYHGHLAPGGFLLAWLLTAWAPLNPAVMATPLLLMQAVALVLFWQVLVRCFGRRWAILVPFTVFAASPLVQVPTLWWSFGMQFVPVLFAAAAALHAHVRYLQEGGRWAIGSVGWTVFGLLFYEKAAFIPILLLGVTILLRKPLRPDWRLWACHAVLLTGFAVLFLTKTSSQVGTGSQAVSAGTVADVSGRMLADTLLPGLAGGPWAGAAGGDAWAPMPVVVWGSLLVLAVAVLVAGVRVGGARAWQAWALLGLAFVVDVALVASTRLTEVGPGVGDDPRYVADLALVAALCGAFAFLAPDAELPRERPFALAVSGVLLVSSIVGFLGLSPALRFDHSRQYVDNVRAAVEQDPDLMLFDTFVPGDIVHEWFGDDSRASRVVGLVPGVHFDQPTGRMSMLDASGTPRKIVAVDPVARGLPGTVPNCGTTVNDDLVRIPLDAPVLGRYLLRVDYFTSEGGEGVVDRDGMRTPVWFQAGLHTLYVPMDGLFDKVGLQLSSRGAPVCVPKLEVGRPVTSQ